MKEKHSAETSAISQPVPTPALLHPTMAQTSWHQCGTREQGKHNVLEKTSKYWHFSLLYHIQGKDISSNLCCATLGMCL